LKSNIPFHGSKRKFSRENEKGKKKINEKGEEEKFTDSFCEKEITTCHCIIS
jgi:hypothetical protein